MILFPNGHSLEYVTASGAFGYYGKGWLHERLLGLVPGLFEPELFTHFAKTVTRHPRLGNFRFYNPFRCIRFIPDGVVNAYGLSNAGFDHYFKQWQSMDLKKVRLAISILGTPDELCYMACRIDELDVVAIELNVSCPNTENDILKNIQNVIDSCTAVREVTQIPIILKLSVVHKIRAIVPRVKDMVSAFSVNSVPWRIAFPEKKSPLARFGGGGVSGKAAQKFTWPFAEELQAMSQVPVIAPSVWEFGDIGILRNSGFQAFSFGAICLRYPWRPTVLAKSAKTWTISNKE